MPAFIRRLKLSCRGCYALGAVATELVAFCNARGIKAPSRSSVYNAAARARAPNYDIGALPEHVCAVLHNRDHGPSRTIPGDLLVFHAFNYGSPAVLSFAAGMPWLCLLRARDFAGWRPKSRALLEAVLAYRKI